MHLQICAVNDTPLAGGVGGAASVFWMQLPMQIAHADAT
jgi:hypothetical protein